MNLGPLKLWNCYDFTSKFSSHSVDESLRARYRGTSPSLGTPKPGRSMSRLGTVGSAGSRSPSMRESSNPPCSSVVYFAIAVELSVALLLAIKVLAPAPLLSISYMAERVVGHGSFGVVFQAKCLEIGETVAIKK
ncbi:hypothetical protein Dimus_010209, partial [Dionaea muscipula]